ncbi:Chromosome partition protein smc-like, partial [Tropilaelaps mercedesae]
DDSYFASNSTRRNQMLSLIAAELRHVWLLDKNSDTSSVSNIDDALDFFDDRRFSGLTFVNQNGDIATRNSVTVGRRTCSYNLISAYQDYLKLPTELEIEEKVNKFKMTQQEIRRMIRENDLALIQIQEIISGLSNEREETFRKKYSLEKRVTATDHIVRMHCSGKRKAERILRIMLDVLEEKRHLAEERNRSPQNKHTQLKQLIDRIQKNQIELAAGKEECVNIQQRLKSMGENQLNLQERLSHLTASWITTPDLMLDNMSQEIQRIQHEIDVTQMSVLDHHNHSKGLVKNVHDIANFQEKLDLAANMVNVNTESLIENEQKLAGLHAKLNRLCSQYTYLGGGNAPLNKSEEQFANLGQLDAVRARRELDNLRGELAQMPIGTCLINSNNAEEFALRLADYRSFHTTLMELEKMEFDNVENKLFRVRQTIERSALDGIQEQMQRVFKLIVPKGQVKLIPAYSIQNGENGTHEGELVSLQIKAKFKPSEPFRGTDMFSGGQRAIMSLVLVATRNQINEHHILLLDEVDAPFDELRCIKFAELLKELSRETQIIFVSHRLNPDMPKSIANRVHKVYRHNE